MYLSWDQLIYNVSFRPSQGDLNGACNLITNVINISSEYIVQWCVSTTTESIKNILFLSYIQGKLDDFYQKNVISHSANPKLPCLAASRVNQPLFVKCGVTNWIFRFLQEAKQPNHVIHKTGKQIHKMKNTLTKVISL